MEKKWITLIALLVAFGLTGQKGWADDLDELEGISENNSVLAASGVDDDLDTEISDDEEVADDSEPKISIGGYIKLLGYWNEEKYSDFLWNMYQSYPSQPASQEISGYNYIGSRLQLKIEGYLGDHARLFSAFNVNYNNATSLHDATRAASDSDSQNAEVRMVETFVEIYEGSRSWKVGSQLVTWSYLEGLEVPTDRVNARDNSYKSTEYEDSKLPSTGVLMTQTISDTTRLEVMAIPIAKVNNTMEFQNYLYPGTEESPKNKPNQTKWATRFSSTLGKLDYSVSYVEGTDPETDLNSSMNGRAYNRIRSPGIDLQYNLGSVLVKASYVDTITEDGDGDDPLIKNSWNKYVVGGEFNIGSSTVNLYAGQHIVKDFPTDAVAETTNFLLGQVREQTDFISGHVNADFLTGNALNLVLMAANYWDKEGESVQTIVRGTFTYKIADGLELLFSPSYMDILDNTFTDVMTEVTYSF